MNAGNIDLSTRVALVTGGGRGIGATISIVLAQSGADVIINYNTNEAEATKVRDKIRVMGQQAVAIRTDVGDTAQIKELICRVNEEFGRIDIMVNNAGMGQRHQIVDTPDEEWERVMNVNARATFAFARELLPDMIERKFGRFIEISSNIGVYGRGGGSFATYAASKAAMIALTKGIAHEGGPYVTANAICPGPTKKLPIEEDEVEPVQIQEDKQLNWLGIPFLVNRHGTSADIAHAVAFFASDAAEYITGQTLHVSGGLFMP